MISLSELEQIKSNARSIVSEEEETLTEDKEQFSSKVKAVGELIMPIMQYITLHFEYRTWHTHHIETLCIVIYF